LEFPLLQIALFDLIERMLYVAATALAALLFALSVSAYRNTHLKKLLYANIAFSFFGIFLFYEYLEHTIPLDNPFTDIIFPSMALSILVLLFLAIVNKK
jgi:general stress protein CsbA